MKTRIFRPLDGLTLNASKVDRATLAEVNRQLERTRRALECLFRKDRDALRR